jgi:hypothetical protein
MERMYPRDKGGEPFYNQALNEHRVFVDDMKPNDERSQALIKKAVEVLNTRPLSSYDSKGEARLADERSAKGVIGTLAEVWFDDLLQSQVSSNPSIRDRIKITSEAPTFDKGDFDQVDFRITKTIESGSSKEYTAELRSSIPFFSVTEALFRNFRVLGPYHNDIKKSERVKDFYGFIVFDLNQQSNAKFHVKTKTAKGEAIHYSKTATNILNNHIFTEDLKLKSGFSIYFIGGATKEMMADDSISENSSLANASYKNRQGSFLAIKIYNALDAPTFLKLVLGLKRNS